MKVFLIYPNGEGYGRIPLGLSILTACLRRAGHDVHLFDLTFLKSGNLDNEMRERLGIAKKTDTRSCWGEVGDVDAGALLCDAIAAFKPDLIGISILQNNYWTSVELLQAVKERFRAPVVAGGAFATVCPDILLSGGLVDIVVRGEGEGAIVELAAALESGRDYRGIANLAFLVDGALVCNPVRRYVDLNSLPAQDISLFDQRHLAKPFDGRVVRAGYFELSRGCPFSCTYCANYFLNERLYDQEKRHIRFKSPQACIAEIEKLNALYHFNFIFFADENMLSLPATSLAELSRLWKERVRLPFYVSTRVETTSEEKLAILKDMGCATIAYGIECGNDEFRRKMLKRFNTNEQIIRAFALCRKYGIRTTANNIFGFPHETEELIFDTIRLNRDAAPDSFSNSIFAPYMGTELHDVCLKAGFIEPGVPKKITMLDESILKMPQLSKERIFELYMNFMKYISGELAIPGQAAARARQEAGG